jgi:hypothetical protein
VEPATIDRIQRMIDAEAMERFPPDAMPQLVLLHYGDHPVIEPGGLYLRVILGQDGATRDAWMEEHFDRLEDFRAQRLPEVKQDLTPADIRLGPVDLEMLDTVITAGTAASRAEAIGWVLARIRERPAYARLEERARELDELKACF